MLYRIPGTGKGRGAAFPDGVEGGEMLSYSRGPDEPLWEKTIGQVLDQTVERWGDPWPWFPVINRSGIPGGVA